MNLRTVVAAVAAAGASVLAGATPVLADTAVPIAVSDCTVFPTTAGPGGDPYTRETSAGLYVDRTRIVYVNHGDNVATQVTFSLRYGGDSKNVVDSGSFARGATINHTFGDFIGDPWSGFRPDRCTVVSVRYADGTTWHADPADR